ncbi:MAG: hypothetical protein QF767_08590, partial [Alphaproteobacteria bacterium]|nr:hypothetical protein [Alphaproteobacteria bacterium]
IINATRLVKKGKVICCAIPLDKRGPVHPARDLPEHWMRFGAGDYALGAPGGGSSYLAAVLVALAVGALELWWLYNVRRRRAAQSA